MCCDESPRLSIALLWLLSEDRDDHLDALGVISPEIKTNSRLQGPQERPGFSGLCPQSAPHVGLTTVGSIFAILLLILGHRKHAHHLTTSYRPRLSDLGSHTRAIIAS